MYDWSKSEWKPAITGYVFHNTSILSLFKILKDGYLEPRIGDLITPRGSISFTLDPCFSVTTPSVTLVLSEKIIKTKYGGKEPEFRGVPEERRFEVWKSEMEIEVKGKRVYIKDCVEILPERACCWKYTYGFKYHFKDIRERLSGPWRTLRGILE